MITLDPMATQAEPSPLERLQSLVHAQAGPAREWRTKLPTLVPPERVYEMASR
jgi:hypothetical protein